MAGRGSDVVAMVSLALSVVGASVGYAALIFAGPLETGLPRATSSFMLGTAITTLYVGLRSRLVPVIGGAQDGPAVVIVAVSAGVVARGSSTAATDVIVMIGLVAMVTALAMLVIGRLGLGKIVRYLPTTVISAFIAGTGWLLFKGGLSVMVSRDIGIGDLGDLFSVDLAKLWIPGLILGLTLLACGQTDRIAPIVSSALVFGSVGGFFLIALTTSSMSAIEDGQWLVGPFGDGAGLTFISATDVSNIAWSGVVSDLPGLLSVVAVAIVALLLNLTGLESVTRSSVDVDHELVTAGVANLAISPFGGLVGFHALGDSVLARQLGATDKAVPVGAGLMAASFALFGSELVGLVPRLVVGGLLVTVGLALLVRWGEELLRTISWTQRVFSCAIVLAIAFIGILEGIAVGLIAATMIFVFQYSRIDPVRLASSGTQLKSHVDRSATAARLLTAAGDQLAIYQLQGYLFFGSISQLNDRVRSRGDEDDSELEFVVLDFRQVTGIDWSGWSLLARLAEEADSAGRTVLLCAMSNDVERLLRRSEPAFAARVRVFETLDEALEAVEEMQLSASVDGAGRELPERAELSDELLASFETTTAREGETIMAQGDPSDAFHIVVSGQLSAYRLEGRGIRQRLRRFGEGAMIGEIGLVTEQPRSADVAADSDVELLTMSRAEYLNLRHNRPDLILELHDYILRGQAERVVSLSSNLARALR